VSVLGHFVTPSAALNPDVTTPQITFNGSSLTADVSSVISDVNLDRTIMGASTITVTCLDPYRTLLNSGIFKQRTTCTIDTLSFVLVEVTKTQDTIAAIFEDAVVNALRQKTGQRALTGPRRGDAIKLLLAEVPGLKATVYEGGVLQESVGRGTTDNPKEDSWTCIQRLANEVQWRAFSDGEEIFVGPDSWLIEQPVLATLQEFQNGVDNIDFDYDVGKPMTTATVSCLAELWDVPPGQPVALASMGVANGKWLVEEISRSIYFKDATITLAKPVAPLPEPSTTSNASSTTDAGSVTSLGLSDVQQKVVQFVINAIGTPYVWGGESPTGYDCSGLAQAAYKKAGIAIPRTTYAQYASLPHVNPPYQPADLIYFEPSAQGPGHVGIYVGNGQMVDAPHTGVPVRLDNVYSGVVGACRPVSS